MIEDLAWEMFALTGNIDEYLLYINAVLPEEQQKVGMEYGADQDGRRGIKAHECRG